MLRHILKSKIHRAKCTQADPDYEGSIEIPSDLMEAVDIWPGERVLVTSATAGGRLETYAQPGPAGSGRFILNGGAVSGSLLWYLLLQIKKLRQKKLSVTKTTKLFVKTSNFTLTPINFGFTSPYKSLASAVL